ncbi:class I SAM-dependent methyltransferase [Yoonia sediminilitoris]|uniref:Phosphatidylethanolamine N-methyltransferase /phosphatidyl-N-methylethanolamine N-methyltransferase n=1 Tax=Yoonia sediminilitoris TaxID=1286148 RepID=A0A2T6KRJ7_9RHOB|nr:class I SAM-dependent methyltransferase [Yoonia sediminilitoris]PUB19183.1 phosphatidylethanolamine N-methyltransferase /phosphatidyl-N-methylethanolamine N-methyltransferase [Yoonia sediminilitoris]RCW99351.1 phosphatidylethanolamine N-methyltransferase /phosphatidyl-N-methylethanolamine N-methyltransferase [Yoonia sediminilitoris]
MEIGAVSATYARWAPIYDKTFGKITNAGRRKTVAHVNRRQGTVLEVGVGTGLALREYDPHLAVTGIDFSEEMLAKAQAKVVEEDLTHVKSLRQMDARLLDFADDSFDTVVAMHIVSVVPEPEKVVAEMARVCRPGGQIVITNHFSRDKGFLAMVERLTAPFANLLGWHSDFPIDAVMGEENLEAVEQQSFPPVGLMTFLVFEKRVTQ